MSHPIFPQDQVFWYLKRPDAQPLRTPRAADVIVIGGGMSGLTAAQAFARKGKKVILLEAFYCGAGASGKSSGFITPNGEISLSQFIHRHGIDGGKAIWDAIHAGSEHIRQNIHRYQLDCDYTEQDSLELASTAADFTFIAQEAESLARLGYATTLVSRQEVPQWIGSSRYFGGVMYANNFGINAYKYCQGMKEVLMREGVEIYEETPVLDIFPHKVTTVHASVTAPQIIVCTDRFTPHVGKLPDAVYHVQNFLLVSQSLPEEIIRQIFPQRRLMAWDTDLIYSYYRMTNDRLLLGGGSLLKAYNSKPTYHSHYMYRKLTNYLAHTFPGVTIPFEQMWPGLIGVSKDIAPLAGQDQQYPSIYYIVAPAGLSLAAMLGNYSAQTLLDGADYLRDYFSPYRTFPVSSTLQKLLGTRLAFALSHFARRRS